MFSLRCARTNGWVNSRDDDDLRRHCGHYDAIVMKVPGILFAYYLLLSKLILLTCRTEHFIETADCRALCAISKWLHNWHGCYGRTSFCEISVWREFRKAIQYCTILQALSLWGMTYEEAEGLAHTKSLVCCNSSSNVYPDPDQQYGAADLASITWTNVWCV